MQVNVEKLKSARVILTMCFRPTFGPIVTIPACMQPFQGSARNSVDQLNRSSRLPPLRRYRTCLMVYRDRFGRFSGTGSGV